MSIVILDVDLGKNSCSVVGVDATGAVVPRRSMGRQTLIDYVMKLPACVVALARIAWAALRKETSFERGYPVAA